MLELISSNSHETEFRCSKDTTRWLRFHLQATDKVFFRRNGLLVQDEKRRVFLEKTPTGCKVLTGHLLKIKELCEEEEVSIEFPKNTILPRTEPHLDGITLYPYQTNAVKHCFQARRGILRLPTGSGKTEVVFAALSALKTRIRAIVLVNRTGLVKQWVERGQKYGFKMGVIHQKVFLWGDIVIASVDTLRNRLDQQKYLDLLESREYWFIDECHETTDIHYRISEKCPNVILKAGLSATPETTSNIRNLMVEGILGKTIFSVDPSELTEIGVNPSLEYHVKALTHARKGVARDYKAVYEDQFYYNPELIDDIIQKMNEYPTQNALIFVDYLEHCFTLSSLLNSRRISEKNPVGDVLHSKHISSLLKINKYYENKNEKNNERSNKYQITNTTNLNIHDKSTQKSLSMVKGTCAGAQLDLHTHAREARNTVDRVQEDLRARKWSCAYAHAHAREIDFEKHNVWVVTPFVSTGVDFKNIHHIFLAGGMKSRNRFLQRIGRGQRRSDPNILKVHDYYIKGMPFIHRHFVQRLKSFQAYYPEAKIIYAD